MFALKMRGTKQPSLNGDWYFRQLLTVRIVLRRTHVSVGKRIQYVPYGYMSEKGKKEGN